MKKSSLEKIVRSLENSVSKDETRLNLGHVLINKTEIIATDGHILSQVALDDEAFLEAEEIYVHREQLLYLKLILKSLTKHQTLVERVIVGQKTLQIQDREVSSKDVNYPNYKVFFPNYTETQKIGFDVEYLYSLVTALRNDKRRICVLEFKINRDGKTREQSLDKASPIIVMSDGNRGVLMPVRI